MTITQAKRPHREIIRNTFYLAPGYSKVTARDDKGRAVTDLQFLESDGVEELPIQLADF
jgi:hypothetical protein